MWIFVGYEFVPDDILSVDDLGYVEDNPGDVAAEEHKHDADDDGGEIDLFLHRLSLAAVGVPGKKLYLNNIWGFVGLYYLL